MSGRFYRLTELQSQQWIAQYPQLARYYDHREYDWEDDVEGDEIYLIPDSEELILHIALSEHYTPDYSEDSPRVNSQTDTWHCVDCARYAVPLTERVENRCVQCAQQLQDRAHKLKSVADQIERMRKD